MRRRDKKIKTISYPISEQRIFGWEAFMINPPSIFLQSKCSKPCCTIITTSITSISNTLSRVICCQWQQWRDDTIQRQRHQQRQRYAARIIGTVWVQGSALRSTPHLLEPSIAPNLQNKKLQPSVTNLKSNRIWTLSPPSLWYGYGICPSFGSERIMDVGFDRTLFCLV